MRIAYLIKHAGEKAELVAHGPVTEIKPKFIAAKIEKGDELVLIGPDIRTKRRGKSGDVDAYLAIVEKENAAMREKAKREAKAKPAPETKQQPQPLTKSEAEAKAQKDALKAEAQKQLNKK